MAEPRQQALIPVSDQHPARFEDGPTEITRLLQMALDKNVPVEALEKLVALHERVSDRMAAQEFAGALAGFQRECPPISRTSTANIATAGGAKFSYKYAELDEIARTIGPMLHARGFSYSWDSTVDKGMLTCVCTLRHVNGHSIHASFACPTDSKAGMSEAQKFAAALTFAKRMALISVTGITTADPDTDGADARSHETITESQAADLDAKIDEVKADRVKFLRWLKVTKVSEIKAVDFRSAVAFLEEKARGAR